MIWCLKIGLDIGTKRNGQMRPHLPRLPTWQFSLQNETNHNLRCLSTWQSPVCNETNYDLRCLPTWQSTFWNETNHDLHCVSYWRINVSTWNQSWYPMLAVCKLDINGQKLKDFYFWTTKTNISTQKIAIKWLVLKLWHIRVNNTAIHSASNMDMDNLLVPTKTQYLKKDMLIQLATCISKNNWHT